jgi:hypothetical protein
MRFKRYQVVSSTVLRGQFSTESFRVHDALANEPILRDIIFANEQEAQEFADKLNAAESTSIHHAMPCSSR